MRDRRAVILDRDGTVIVERHYLSDPDQVELIPGVAIALRQLRQMGLRLVILTNQSGIGRGLFDANQVEAVHQRMCALLAAEGVQLDGIFYCPHTPQDGCACRKPAPGLVEHAAQQLGFDPQASIVIGDKACDMELGRGVGATTLLVQTGYGRQMVQDCQAHTDYVVDDLPAAIPVIARLLERSSDLRPATTDVVVLCGGRGSRLGRLSVQTPKPLLPVAGRPFLLHLLCWMKQEGFSRTILSAYYLAEQFQEFIKTYADLVPGMELLVEPEPLGTGGALRYAADAVRSSTFVALNGDSWLPQSLTPVFQEHARTSRRFTAVVVPASQVEGGAVDKGRWRIGPGGTVEGFSTEALTTDGWVNAGLYVIERALACAWPRGAFSLEANLPRLLEGQMAGVFRSAERLLDIGTPACYAMAQRLLTTPAEAEPIQERRIKATGSRRRRGVTSVFAEGEGRHG